MKNLYYTNESAFSAVKALHKHYELSSCDCRELDSAIGDRAIELMFNKGIAGELACYRTDDGDIFAWWQEEDEEDYERRVWKAIHHLEDFTQKNGLEDYTKEELIELIIQMDDILKDY